MVYWVDAGGRCYGVVSEHGSPLRLDGQCVGHPFILVVYVFLMLVVHVLVAFCRVLILVVVMSPCGG